MEKYAIFRERDGLYYNGAYYTKNITTWRLKRTEMYYLNALIKDKNIKIVKVVTCIENLDFDKEKMIKLSKKLNNIKQLRTYDNNFFIKTILEEKFDCKYLCEINFNNISSYKQITEIKEKIKKLRLGNKKYKINGNTLLVSNIETITFLKLSDIDFEYVFDVERGICI